jgi:plasmid stability protein
MYLMPVMAMPKMIQLRNVPDDIHRALKIKATQAGMSLSDFLVREVSYIARRPSLEEVLERIRQHDPVELSEDSATAVRAERESRK